MTEKNPTIEPLGYRVLIRKDDPTLETASGIILAVDESREYAAQTRGTVVAVGPRAWTDPGDESSYCSVGDYVLFARHSGVAIDVDNKYSDILINDRDVLGRLEDA